MARKTALCGLFFANFHRKKASSQRIVYNTDNNSAGVDGVKKKFYRRWWFVLFVVAFLLFVTVRVAWSCSTAFRERVIALGSINGVAYASASEAQKDAWLVDNADRVLFGATKSNASSNDHSTSLANIDNTTDKLSPAMISLAKRIAQTASPKIRPIKTSEDEEWFVMFAGPQAFRDGGQGRFLNDTHFVHFDRDLLAVGKSDVHS